MFYNANGKRNPRADGMMQHIHTVGRHARSRSVRKNQAGFVYMIEWTTNYIHCGNLAKFLHEDKEVGRKFRYMSCHSE